MVKIREVIVVEGRYDKNTLSQVVDATILETKGFGIFKDKAQLRLLRRAAQARGLIVLTDSDGAGFVIRNYLRGVLPPERVKHAYIPDVPGKERRKAAPGKEGKLGVEGMSPELLLEALRRAGATVEGETAAPTRGRITKADLVELGLSGGVGSGEKRLTLLKKLGLPEHMSPNAMLQALNLLYTREELEALL
ncbi:MAG: toprim domain-containing protein [Oscillospiraceae bacterium]|nr:DUF4093 domain-containing protein [Bacillota bacterium]